MTPKVAEQQHWNAYKSVDKSSSPYPEPSVMKRLRDDLLISDRASGAILVKDPVANKAFEFSEPESYLLKALTGPYHETVLLARYNAKYETTLSQTDLHTFLARLDSWGLLERGAIAGESNAHIEAYSQEVTPSPDHEGEQPEDTATMEQPDSPPYSDDHDKPQFDNHWSLFQPTRFFDSMLSWFGFLRHFAPLIPLLIGFTTLGVIFNLHLVELDLKTVRFNLNLLQHLIFTLFTVNLGSQLYQGMVARHFNLHTPSFGLALIYGFLPRFNVIIRMPPSSPKRVKLEVAKAALVSRLLLFSTGVVIWLAMRGQGGMLPLFGLSLALFSFISFLFIANPLMGGAGYRWLSEWFDCPELRDKAFRALRYRIFKPPAVIRKYVEDTPALRAYALASVLFILLLLGFISLALANWLELNYGGLGVMVFLLILAFMTLKLLRGLSRHEKHTGAGQEYAADGSHRVVDDGISKTKPQSRINSKKWSLLRPLKRLLVLSILLAVMFLPYSYEAGGPAKVLPIHKNGIYMQYPGVIERVFYNGGEWLEKDTVIARTANFKQQRDVDAVLAQIKKKQEELQILMTTPSPEQIALAQRELNTAKMRLAYSRKSLGRIEILHRQGDVSQETYDEALKEEDTAHHEVLEKKENLRVVKTRVNPHEIKSIKAEIELLQHDLVYYRELLARTELKMPFDGRIITMRLKDLENTYLEDNDLFAEVEDSRYVSIEIDIPESDIGVVAIGGTIRLKPLLAPDKIVEGEISQIYPTSFETDYGNIIKVLTVIDNEDQTLRSGMTGYAKINGKEMFLGEAFGRAFLRFIQIEVWSWLP
jgi:putative peptide zinc metalloprotease protein